MQTQHELEIENQKLKRDLKLLEQSLQQAKLIKKAYNDSAKLLKDKDLQLEKQLARTDAIFNSQSSIVIVTNGKNLKNVNKAFFDNFPFQDFADFLSKHVCICELFIDKKTVPHLTPMIDDMSWVEYVSNNKKQNHEAYMTDKNGKERVYKVTTGETLFEGDEKEEVVVFTDITEIKKQSSLLHSQARLASMGEMISMIAHQWRQPLASLNTILSRMSLQVEMDLVNTESFLKGFNSSNELIQYMTKTIDDFSTFFKSNDSNVELQIIELINKPKRLMETSFKTHEINFEDIYLLSGDTKIVINSSQVDQVLLNIYKNALDEFKRREIQNPTLTVIVKELNQNGSDWLKIDIIDNAGGIDEAIIDKIFEPYFSTKSRNGMGIGLYMTKIIVENHLKGIIEVKNQDGGACFQIRLPLKKCPN